MKSFSKERRITLMMGTITVVFFLCVAPYFIYFLAPGKPEAKEKVLPYIVMLMYLNSVVNPVLYISINSSIRKATLRMFSCKKTPDFVLGNGECFNFSNRFQPYVRASMFMHINFTAT